MRYKKKGEMNAMPAYVSEFLQLSKRIQDLHEQESMCKKKVLELQPRMSSWLQRVPFHEIRLQFNNEETTLFGDAGTLRFCSQVPRKENLCKDNLVKYLSSFFNQRFPDKTDEEIQYFAVATADHVLRSRKCTVRKPIVVRTFTKKRKQR